MGLGAYALGAEPAGLDPVLPPSPQAGVGAPPTALKFDLTLRQWVFNANGTLASVHPVDQRVVLALGFALGKIPAAPGIGNTLRSIPRVVPATIEAQVDSAVHAALDDMVTSGEITINEIDVWPQTNGFITQVVYTNLITQQQDTVTR